MSVFAAKPWLGSYSPEVPHLIDVPEDSLIDVIEESVRRYPGHTALEFFGATTSYRELGEAIDRAAEGLRALGVKAGERVALVLPNCPQHLVAFYAALRLGAIVVEHNPLYTPRELRHQFEDHGAKTAIVWDKLAATVADFPAEMGVETIVAVDVTRAMPLGMRVKLRLPVAAARAGREKLTLGHPAPGAVDWASLLKHAPIAAEHPRPLADDTALLQYTSGTTGTPKGAVLSHRNLIVNSMQGQAWLPGPKPGAEVFYGVLPMFHAFGLTLCITSAMSMGARLVLFPAFDPELVLAAARKNPPTFLPAVPPVYDRMLTAADAAGVSLGSIRFAISGAMALPPALVERWEAGTDSLLVEGYGMTESSPIISVNPVAANRRAGTVGLPLPNIEIRVVDPEQPHVHRGFDEAGELLVRGPQVFSGYWNRPSDSAEVLLAASVVEGDAAAADAGLWLRTGDIVTVSPDGFISIVDRAKELIVTGGFNVSPTEVEAALLQHPDVLDIAVVGAPDADGAEVVTAAVVLAPGVALDADELRTFAKGSLTPYKVPRRFVQVDELPRSLIGKVLRRQVQQQIAPRPGS
ncbi:long-chain-fatty-acid--CoA ligase [Microterricola viridarii]|nr:long-chain-fatty-acid--CoA ligase [Microterricola viridarii]